MKLKFQLATIILLSLIVFLTFWPTLNNGFTNWDDNILVLDNHFVKALTFEHLKHIFTTTIQKVYVPLTLTSFTIEYHFFKADPFIYHLDNLVLHISVVVLIFMFALKMRLSPLAAFLSSILFGIHPMHVESVAWITERKDVLYSFFYMLALYHYLEHLEGKKHRFGLTIVWGILSMLSKPMALSLPLAFLVCDWFKGRKFNKTVWIEKIIHFAYIIPITWITYSQHARVPHVVEGNAFLVWIWTATFYIKKFFVPFDLVPLYQLPKPVGIENGAYLLALFIFCLIVLFLVYQRKNKLVLFAFMFYFVTIFFIFRLDDLKDECIVADRFMYLPSLGLCLWGGYWLNEQIQNVSQRLKMSFIIVIVFLCGVLMFKTWHQTQVWNDSMSLWNYVITKDSNSATGYLNRGATYNREEKYDLAIQDLNKAIRLSPTSDIAYNDRGMAYGMKGQYEAAFKDFSKAIELNANYPEAFANRGEAYRLENKYDLALSDFNKAILMNPYFPGAYFNRSKLYESLKEYDRALLDAKKAKDLGTPVNEQYILDLEKAARNR
jgi:tetratricopeptide (TPR) repeat protein